MEIEENGDTLIALTADIVAAHASNNRVAVNDLPQLISSVHGDHAALARASAAPGVRHEPKVPVRSPIMPDYIVCLEDGEPLKMLKRHLRANNKLTPDQYRQKWGLNFDYPMVASNYAEQRRGLAISLDLGTKRCMTAKTVV